MKREKEILKKYLLKTPQERWGTSSKESFFNVIHEKYSQISDKEIEKTFNDVCKEVEQTESIGRIKQIEKIENEVDFEQWQEVVKSNFPELLFSAEVGLSLLLKS